MEMKAPSALRSEQRVTMTLASIDHRNAAVNPYCIMEINTLGTYHFT